ncbi:hypothetical protein RFI_12843 [Reticulomyxa filosa]|uniref:VWFA domain-containing protein n=1 Tax=Reticulomyxa filosa TaxID=46433 RepID=X6NG53_RETFI|nr:hypothetical protein RFI_12843 [Reticulomyxa filosa]|eukprot:ETO24317.1 hypothetical protein RFI_12843 [Reticulomyxa filosa]
MDGFDGFRPLCPVIMFQDQEDSVTQLFSIHCEKLQVDVECYENGPIKPIKQFRTRKKLLFSLCCLSLCFLVSFFFEMFTYSMIMTPPKKKQTIKIKNKINNNNQLNCIFLLPTSGTVMSVSLRIGEDRVLTTAVVSNKDKNEIIEGNQNKSKKKEQVGGTPEFDLPPDQHIPDLFRLPFNGVKSGETIHVSCYYLQTLEYYKTGYALSIPLYFPKGAIVENVKWEDVVQVRCKINALSSNTKVCFQIFYIHSTFFFAHNLGFSLVFFFCTLRTYMFFKKGNTLQFVRSHEVSTKKLEDGSIIVKTLECIPVPEGNRDDHPMYSLEEPLSSTGRDFELSFSVKSEGIVVHAISKKDEETEQKDSHSMCVFVTPPISLSKTFGRAIFFILDRSGSMTGEPFQEATRALYRGLDRLREIDMFGVCSFDHRQMYFKQTLISATKENVNAAKAWIQQYGPTKGGTVMDAPIEKALEVLEESDLLPFIMLITDGAVHNEKEICNEIKQKQIRTRFLTLGIGSYCNWFFLKVE